MTDDEIFARSARRRAFHGVARAPRDDRWVLARMAEELLFRLDTVKRDFESVLLLGPYAPWMAEILDAQGLKGLIASAHPAHAIWPTVQTDEDRLAIRDKSFDLVLSIGGLDTVNDVPGALILFRRVLKPGGLFMGAMAGAGCLGGLRSLLTHDSQTLRSHPQIDVRASGDLLSRAGFTMPVADADLVEASYPDLDRLIGDIRANALGNCLAKRHPMTRVNKLSLSAEFDAAKDENGRFTERFGLIYFTGWAPDA